MRWRWHVIADLCKKYALHAGAEIGVEKGRFSAALLDLCPDVKLWGVDSFAFGYKNSLGNAWSTEVHDANRVQARSVVARFPERFELIEKPSAEAAENFADQSLDFVFIDADHGYDGCLSDIKAWSPKVRYGGWITGHDFDHRKWPGVVRAVEESFADFYIKDDFVWMARQ